MRLLLSFVALTVVAACSTPPTGLAAEVPGTSWTVERVFLPDSRLMQGGGEISFGDEGSVAMSSCNQCSGRYTMRDSVLTIDGALGCTKKACPTDVLELERYFLEGVTLRQQGTYLVVRPADSTGVEIYLARDNVSVSPAASRSGSRES